MKINKEDEMDDESLKIIARSVGVKLPKKTKYFDGVVEWFD